MMAEQGEGGTQGQGARGADGIRPDGAAASARDDEENELEAEQESAEAMDAEVPQPPGADRTTEGQPS